MDVNSYLPLIAALVALLAGLAIGKAWERYKLRDGRWIDRRRARESQHYVLGLNFLVSNQIDLAIEELSRAARVDSDALEIHMILGNVYRERGQVARAIQLHQGLLQRPKLTRLEHAYVLLCLGLDFKRGGFVDRALEAFKEVLRLDPDNQYALLYLQKLHEEQHQWNEAYRIRRQLMELSGPDTQPRNQAILGFLENALGVDAMKEGKREEAARHFESAIEMDPSTTPAYVNLGDVRLADNDPAAAAAAWNQLIEVSPERAHLALERLEKLYDQQGASHRFEERCRQFIAGRPQDWRARLAPFTSTGRFVLASSGDSTGYVLASDLMVTDHSSIGFEFCVLDRPLIVYDAPRLAAEARINPAKIALLRSAATVVRTPAELRDAVAGALGDPGALSAARRRVADEVFYRPGTATDRAIETVYELLELPPGADVRATYASNACAAQRVNGSRLR